MRWPPWRRREIEHAERVLEEVQQRRPAVERLTHDLRARGERNNFAPMVVRALKGGRS